MFRIGARGRQLRTILAELIGTNVNTPNFCPFLSIHARFLAHGAGARVQGKDFLIGH